MIGFIDFYLQQELDKFDAFLDNPMPEKVSVKEHAIPCRKVTPDGKEYFDWPMANDKPVNAEILLMQLGLNKE